MPWKWKEKQTSVSPSSPPHKWKNTKEKGDASAVERKDICLGNAQTNETRGNDPKEMEIGRRRKGTLRETSVSRRLTKKKPKKTREKDHPKEMTSLESEPCLQI